VDSPQTVISFCTGFGGLELGIRRAGVDVFPIVYLENETFVQANLVEKIETGKMAPAPIWSDVATFDAQPFRGMVDGCIGGYPCQPFSTAGKRKGEKDPRHLWPHIREHIRTIRPVWCFFENVEGHITLGLRNVIKDLVGMDYRTTFGIFSAEEVGAPHQRKRVYILGNSKHDGLHEASLRRGSKAHSNGSEKGKKKTQQPEGTSGRENLPNLQGAELAHTKNGRGEPSERKRGKGSKRGSEDRSGYLEEGREAFPARPGEKQYGWEEPRVVPIEPELGGTVDGTTCGVDANQHRVDRLRLLGNGVVPQTAELAWKTLWREMNAQENNT
jgi:DNA (cytosine-5)-methyltransferase 1